MHTSVVVNGKNINELYSILILEYYTTDACETTLNQKVTPVDDRKAGPSNTYDSQNS